MRLIRWFINLAYIVFFILCFIPIVLSLLALISITNAERALLIIFGVANAVIFAELSFGKWKK